VAAWHGGGGGGPWEPGWRGPGPQGPPHGPELPLFRLLRDLAARLHAWFGAPGQGRRRMGLLVGLLVLLWLASGFYRVQPDELGVVQRFGAFVRIASPGLNYHLPWPVETVTRPSVTRINRVEIGFRSGMAAENETREVSEESLMLTGDENIIDIDFTVFWRIRNASDYLFGIRHPAGTVKSVAESVMREVIGRTPIQPALTGARGAIEEAVRSGTQAILDRYGAGIEITEVQLQKVDPPPDVIDSFRDVQRANTDAERMRNEAEAYRNDVIPRARGEAAQIVAAADGERAAAIAEAKGAAARFESVLAAYRANKDITLARLYIETMERVLKSGRLSLVDPALKTVIPIPAFPAAGAPATAAPGNTPKGSTP
jgi:membrane protease subunit HflK